MWFVQKSIFLKLSPWVQENTLLEYLELGHPFFLNICYFEETKEKYKFKKDKESP